MKRTPYFFVSTIIMIIVVIIGFSPSLIFRPVFKDTTLPTALIIHGTLNMLWFVLLLYQSWAVFKNKIINHKKIGLWGFALAIVLVIMNFVIIYGVITKYHSGEYSLQVASGLALGNFVVIVVNSILIILAYYFRNRPGFHKRLIYLFSLSLAGFAFDRIGRMTLDTGDVGINGVIMGYAIHLIFITSLIIYDIKIRKRPHVISVLGIFIPLVSLAIIFSLLGNGYGEVFLNLF